MITADINENLWPLHRAMRRLVERLQHEVDCLKQRVHRLETEAYVPILALHLEESER